MAEPIIETISEANANAVTSLVVTAPVGIADDDILLIWVACDGDASNPQCSSGGAFTQIGQISEGAVEGAFLWRRAASESGDYTVTWTGSEACRITMFRISGCVISGSPFDVIGSGTTNAGSTTSTVTALTSTVIETLAIAVCAVDRNRVDAADGFSDAQGFTEVGTSGSSAGGANGVGTICGQKDIPSIGGTGTPVFGTWVSDENVNNMVLLKPVVGDEDHTVGDAFGGADSVFVDKTFIRSETMSGVDSTVMGKTNIVPDAMSGADALVYGRQILFAETLAGADSVIKDVALALADSIAFTESILSNQEFILRQFFGIGGFLLDGVNRLNNAKAIWGTDANKQVENFASYVDQTDADASWVTSDTKNRVDVTNNLLAINAVRDGTKDTCKFTFPSFISNVCWTLRFKWTPITVTQDTNPNTVYCGISGAPAEETPHNDSMDFVGIFFRIISGGDRLTRFVSKNDTTTLSTNTLPDNLWSAGTPMWIQIQRLSKTKMELKLYSDSEYSIEIASDIKTISSKINELDGIHLTNNTDNVSDVGVLDSEFDNFEFWDGLNISGPPAFFGTEGEQKLEEFDTYVDQADADASWVPTDAANAAVNVTTNVLEQRAIRDGSNDSVGLDTGSAILGNKNEAKFVLRCKIKIIGDLSGSGENRVFFGMADVDQTNNPRTDVMDYSGWCVRKQGASFTFGHRLRSQTNLAFNLFTESWVPAQGDVRFVEYIRNGTTWTLSIFLDENYSVLESTDDITDTTSSGDIIDQRYITTSNIDNLSDAFDLAVEYDDIQFWPNVSEVISGGEPIIDEIVFPFENFGLDDDKNIEEFDTYTTQGEANAAWAPNDDVAGKRVDITNDVLDLLSISDNSNDNVAFDSGVTFNDLKWILRFKLDIIDIDQGSTTADKIVWIVLGDTDETVSSSSNQDYVGMKIIADSGGTGWQIESRNGGSTSGDTIGGLDDPANGQTWYMEIRRTNATTFEVNFYSDSDYTTLVKQKTNFSLSAGVVDLRYIKIMNIVISTDGHIQVEIDDVQIWDDTGIITGNNPILDESGKYGLIDEAFQVLQETGDEDHILMDTFSGADTILAIKEFLLAEAFTGTDILETGKDIFLPETFTGTDLLLFVKELVLADTLNMDDILLQIKDAILNENFNGADLLQTIKDVIIIEAMSGTETLLTIKSIILAESLSGADTLTIEQEFILADALGMNEILITIADYILPETFTGNESLIANQEYILFDTLNFADNAFISKVFTFADGFNGADILLFVKEILLGDTFTGTDALLQIKDALLQETFSGSENLVTIKNILLPDNLNFSEIVLKLADHFLPETFTGSDTSIITHEILIAETFNAVELLETIKSILISDGFTGTESLITIKSIFLLESLAFSETIVKLADHFLAEVFNGADAIFAGQEIVANDTLNFSEVLNFGQSVILAEAFGGAETLVTIKNIIIADDLNNIDSLVSAKDAILGETFTGSDILDFTKEILVGETFVGTDLLITSKEIVIPESFIGTDVLETLKDIILAEVLNAADSLITGKEMFIPDTFTGTDDIKAGREQILQDVADYVDSVISGRNILIPETMSSTDNIFISKEFTFNDFFNGSDLLVQLKDAIIAENFIGSDSVLAGREQIIADIATYVDLLITGKDYIFNEAYSGADSVNVGKVFIFSDLFNGVETIIKDVNLILNDVFNGIENVFKDASIILTDTFNGLDNVVKVIIGGAVEILGTTKVKILRSTTMSKLLRKITRAQKY